MLTMTVVDTAMTGWAGTGELAALGLGVAPQLTFQMIAIGFLQATAILAAQAIGAGEHGRAGAVLRAGLAHALALGILFAALSLLGPWFFRLTGQPAAIVEEAGTVTLAFGLGLPGFLLFVACNMFLEATGRPKTGMAIMILAALLDVPLNGIFALGWGGYLEPMGAVGAVATSSLMRSLAFVLALAVLLRWEGRLGDPRGVIAALTWRKGRAPGIHHRFRRIGVPMGLAQGVESAGFSALVILGGRISTEALAAHQATLALLSLIYMVAVGIGGATAIRVGNAVGRGSAADLRIAGWSGIILAGAASLPFALVLFFAPSAVAALFGQSGSSVAITAATIAVAGLVVPFDAMMGASLGALRGAGDVWTAFAIQAGAFWIVAVPLATVLGIAWGLGAPGLIFGVMAGVTVSFALLALRFRAISRRAVRPA
jgi:MATE family multidrug resistance protein